jgi:hypothetical protein
VTFADHKAANSWLIIADRKGLGRSAQIFLERHSRNRRENTQRREQQHRPQPYAGRAFPPSIQTASM